MKVVKTSEVEKQVDGEVSKDVNKVDSAPYTQQKLSYEQLENFAKQLSEQNKQLYMKLQEISNQNVFKRLDYLFKVIEYKDVFPYDFAEKAVGEVIEMMTIPEETGENK